MCPCTSIHLNEVFLLQNMPLDINLLEWGLFALKHLIASQFIQIRHFFSKICCCISIHSNDPSCSQMHMNNIWRAMITSIPCLAVYCNFSSWFIQCIWDISTPTQTIRLYLNVIHSYTSNNYNLMTKSNMML